MKQRFSVSLLPAVLLILFIISLTGCDGFLSFEPPPRDNPEDPSGESDLVDAEIDLSLSGLSFSNDDLYDFGTIILGASAPAVVFTITNNGTTTLYLDGDNPFSFAGTDPGVFEISSSPSDYAVNPGSSTSFTVSFTGIYTAGNYSSLMIINSNTPDFTINFTANVNETAAQIDLNLSGVSYANNSEYDFGDIVLDSQVPEVIFSIKNTGTATLLLDRTEPFSFSGTNSASFASGIPDDYTVDPDSSINFTISFTDVSTVGNYSAVMTINSSIQDYLLNLTANVYELSGTAPDIPVNLAVDSEGVDSIQISWSASNEAQSYNVYRSDTFDGSYTFMQNTSDTYYQDSSLPINTAYFYRVDAQNTYGTSSMSDYIQATTKAPVIYVYYGIQPSETEVVDGGLYDFGSVEADNSSYYDFSSGPVTFTIENLTEALSALSITDIALSGNNSGEFILTENLPAALAAGESSTFTVEFDPVSYGLLENAVITITTDDPVTPVYEINLKGEGLEPSLGGIITDGTNPVAGAYLRLYNDGETVDEYAATDENGYYEFFSIPSGDYYLVVQRDGYDPYTQAVTIP